MEAVQLSITCGSTVPLNLPEPSYPRSQRYLWTLCHQTHHSSSQRNFKDILFSIEEPAFHPLPLKERAQRSQRYLRPGSKTTVCKNILFHYHRGKSLGMLSTVLVIVSKMCLLSAQHQQWIVCILKGKLHVLTLQMVEKVFQIISHLLTVLNKRVHKRQ